MHVPCQFSWGVRRQVNAPPTAVLPAACWQHPGRVFASCLMLVIVAPIQQQTGS